MADDLVKELKKVEKPVEKPVEKVEVAAELTIVDHILAGDMDKAKAAIQKEVVRVVSGDISTVK